MMNHWMFRCKDVTEKISLSMDASLPLLQRMAIRFHLMMCRYCSRFHRQLTALREICSRIESEPMPECDPPGLSHKTKKQLKAKLRSIS